MSKAVLLIMVVVSSMCVCALGQPKISISTMKEMGNVKSRAEFERKFMDKDQYDREQKDKDASQVPVQDGKKMHIGSGRPKPDTKKGGEVSKGDPCSPRLLTVDIPTAGMKPGEMQFPMCTRINQCGGCCATAILECRPTATKKTLVSTRRYSQTRSGLLGQNITYFELDEHLACAQQCRVQAKHCTSKQKYFPNDCECKCKVTQRCNTQIKYFDRSKCACECRQKTTCGDGAAFSHINCRCEAKKMHISADIDVTKVDKPSTPPPSTPTDCSTKRCPPTFTAVSNPDGKCGCKPNSV